ncbi:MAG: hypothetical protein PQJ60_03765 [Spirochaetales bacterium]|nr:hypothetical protein [Spirochaetales bacterium]
MEPEKEVQKKKQFKPVQIVAGAVGIVVGRYSGFSALFPLLIFFPVLLLLKKTAFKKRESPFLYTSCLIFAHSGWVLLGTMLLLGSLPVMTSLANLGEVLFFFSFAIALLVKPKQFMVWGIVVVETALLGVNLYSLPGFAFNTTDHKALVTHIVLRLGIIVLALWGRKSFKKDEADSELMPDSL